MAIFNSYVNLPEGNNGRNHPFRKSLMLSHCDKPRKISDIGESYDKIDPQSASATPCFQRLRQPKDGVLVPLEKIIQLLQQALESWLWVYSSMIFPLIYMDFPHDFESILYLAHVAATTETWSTDQEKLWDHHEQNAPQGEVFLHGAPRKGTPPIFLHMDCWSVTSSDCKFQLLRTVLRDFP